MTKIINVATAAIFNTEEGIRRGMCLYSLRLDDKPRPGMWEWPGGKLDYHMVGGESETPWEAAARECMEELGVTVIPLLHPADSFIGTATIDLVTHIVVLHVVAARLANPAAKPTPIQSQGLRWANPQYAVDSMGCSPGTYPMHRLVIEFMKRHRVECRHEGWEPL